MKRTKSELHSILDLYSDKELREIFMWLITETKPDRHIPYTWGTLYNYLDILYKQPLADWK